MDDSYINGFKDGFLSGIDAKENFKYRLFDMDFDEVLDVLAEHRKKKQSQVPNIPMGFTFNWRNRKEINDVFCELSKQGFKITKE